MAPQAPAVLDASALIALLWEEPGADVIEPLLGAAVISTVNWAEVLQRFSRVSAPVSRRRRTIEALGVTLEPFTGEDAEVVAELWSRTRPAGLSLADRACLALALRLGARAYTADRAWGDLGTGARIVLIR